MRGQLVVALVQSPCGFVVGPSITADRASFADEFYDRRSADESVVHVESPQVVELPAGAAHVVICGRAGEEAAVYLGEEDGLVFNVWCAGAERPADDWPYVVEVLELLAVE